MKKATQLLLLLLFCGASLTAQDFHYSQFHNAPVNLNPALTGVFRGDTRLMANYRSQWSAVPVDYMTFTASADHKFIRRTANKSFFAGGLALHYDQAGLSNLRLIDLNLSGSLTHQFRPWFLGTVGARVGVGQRAFQTGSLTFDNQYDPILGAFDPNLSSQEDFDRTSFFYPDISLGFNLRFQQYKEGELVDRLERRSKLDIGLGVFHLNRPDQSFYDDDNAPLGIRLSPYAMGTLQLGKSFDLIANATGQFQSPYTELVGMLGARVHLNRQLGKQLALQLDFGYRYNDFADAFFPGLEIFYNNWQFGITYDVNVSPFEVATRQRGGIEVSLRYVIRKVPPLGYFQICPLI